MAENRLREAAEHWARVRKTGQHLMLVAGVDGVEMSFMFDNDNCTMARSASYLLTWTEIETAVCNVLSERIDWVVEEMRWRDASGLEPQTA